MESLVVNQCVANGVWVQTCEEWTPGKPGSACIRLTVGSQDLETLGEKDLRVLQQVLKEAETRVRQRNQALMQNTNLSLF